MDDMKHDVQLLLNNNVGTIPPTQFQLEPKSIEVKVEPNEASVKLYIKKEEGIRTAKNLNIRHIIKEEFVFDPQIEGEDVLNDIKQEIVYGTTRELYKDHVIIKDELVIGPDLFQKTIPPSSIVERDHKKYTCEKCSYIGNSHEFHAHKCLYTCDFCTKTFDHRQKIKQHIIKHMPSKNECHICRKWFSYKQNLARHLKIHTGKKPHKCVRCNISFSRKDYLNVHNRRYHSKFIPDHKPTNESLCELCNKAFSTKCSRDHHIKYSCPKNKDKIKEKRNKLYVCDVCNKSYIYRTSLVSHIKRSHTSETMFPLHDCSYCGKRYVKKHNLQCHMLSQHLNMKSYKCKICKATFTWLSTLRTHEKNKHGEV